MSHATKADKLLIKPAAGARPAPPCTRRQIIPKARNAASHPTSHTQHDDNQAGDGPRQTDSTESHRCPTRWREAPGGGWTRSDPYAASAVMSVPMPIKACSIPVPGAEGLLGASLHGHRSEAVHDTA